MYLLSWSKRDLIFSCQNCWEYSALFNNIDIWQLSSLNCNLAAVMCQRTFEMGFKFYFKATLDHKSFFTLLFSCLLHLCYLYSVQTTFIVTQFQQQTNTTNFIFKYKTRFLQGVTLISLNLILQQLYLVK